MTCYHPLKAFRTATGVVFSELRRHDILGSCELPCGRCIGCRMRRASDWSLRVMHEARLWPVNCFVTLTYGRDCLPAEGSLLHRDFQLFMKRLRKHLDGRPVRFYMCGEYGPVNMRPHYHACLFNVDFRSDRVPLGKSGSGFVFYDSPELRGLWTHGHVSVQDLTPATAGYCARYIMKKVLGEGSERAYDWTDADGVVHRRAPEYAAMSLKPGIGAGWLERYKRDVFPRDYVVSDGSKHQTPRYYDSRAKRDKSVDWDSIEWSRIVRGKARVEDRSDERLLVREVVHTARCRNLKRSLE